jgi:hypothetical protein
MKKIKFLIFFYFGLMTKGEATTIIIQMAEPIKDNKTQQQKPTIYKIITIIDNLAIKFADSFFELRYGIFAK